MNFLILGRAIDFEGSRSEKDILNFVSRASGPAVKEPKKTLAALGNAYYFCHRHLFFFSQIQPGTSYLHLYWRKERTIWKVWNCCRIICAKSQLLLHSRKKNHYYKPVGALFQLALLLLGISCTENWRYQR